MKIDERLIFQGLEYENSEEVLKFMADELEKYGYVKGSYFGGLMEREEVFPTGLNFGDYSVAIPHTETEHVLNSTLAIATLKNKVKFKCAEDHEKDTEVSVVCMIAFGEKEDKMDVLTKIIDFFGNKDEVKEMMDLESDKMKKLVKSRLEN